MQESGLVPYELLGDVLDLPGGRVTFRSRLDALLAVGFFLEPEEPATEAPVLRGEGPRLTVTELLGGPELLL